MILRKGKRPLYGLTQEERTLIESYGFLLSGEVEYMYEYAADMERNDYPFTSLAPSEILAIVAVLGKNFFPALATVVQLGDELAVRAFWRQRNDRHKEIYQAQLKLREEAKP